MNQHDTKKKIVVSNACEDNFHKYLLLLYLNISSMVLLFYLFMKNIIK